MINSFRLLVLVGLQDWLLSPAGDLAIGGAVATAEGHAGENARAFLGATSRCPWPPWTVASCNSHSSDSARGAEDPTI